MMTKINTHRTKNIRISLCAFLVTGIFLAGSFITHNEYAKKINTVRDELSTAQNELSEQKKILTNTQNELRQTQEDYQFEFERATQLGENLEDIKSELEVANITINDLKNSKYQLVYMGDFKITYYCDERYSHICGGNGVTASGKATEVGVTAAADWSVLPKGSKVYIQNVGWKEIQDVGGAVNGKHIDVLVNQHQKALDIGTHYEGVWLLVKNE